MPSLPPITHGFGSHPRLPELTRALSDYAAEWLDEIELFDIFVIDGDVAIDGDMDADWLQRVVDETGVALREGVATVVIAGDLAVSGTVRGQGPFHLLVTGSARAHAVFTGGSFYLTIGGDLSVERLLLMTYNDTVAAVDGAFSGPFVVDQDHAHAIRFDPLATVVFNTRFDLDAAVHRVVDPQLYDGSAYKPLVEAILSGTDPLQADVRAFRALAAVIADPSLDLHDRAAAITDLIAAGGGSYVEFSGALQGYTPLHWLGNTRDGSDDGSDDAYRALIRALLDAGADLEWSTASYGFPAKPTPLQHAVLVHNPAVARALIAQGADLHGFAFGNPDKDVGTELLKPLSYTCKRYPNCVSEEHVRHATDHVPRVLSLLDTLGFRRADALRAAAEAYIEGIRAGDTGVSPTYRVWP